MKHCAEAVQMVINILLENFFSVFLINSFLAIFLGMLVLELTEQILEYLFRTFFFAIISTLEPIISTLSTTT